MLIENKLGLFFGNKKSSQALKPQAEKYEAEKKTEEELLIRIGKTLVYLKEYAKRVIDEIDANPNPAEYEIETMKADALAQMEKVNKTLAALKALLPTTISLCNNRDKIRALESLYRVNSIHETSQLPLHKMGDDFQHFYEKIKGVERALQN